MQTKSGPYSDRSIGKRVAQIGSYLLQAEIVDAPDKLNKYFGEIYEPNANDPGRQWPPKVSKVVGYEPSGFPMFSNVLLHVNGARLNPKHDNTAELIFEPKDKGLNFTVIDGQHRINGAYLAVKILQEKQKDIKWEIPAEIFIDLGSV